MTPPNETAEDRHEEYLERTRPSLLISLFVGTPIFGIAVAALLKWLMG